MSDQPIPAANSWRTPPLRPRASAHSRFGRADVRWPSPRAGGGLLRCHLLFGIIIHCHRFPFGGGWKRIHHDGIPVPVLGGGKSLNMSQFLVGNRPFGFETSL